MAYPENRDQIPALARALRNERGVERPVVLKGVYIYKDQMDKMIMQTTQNKIRGIQPATASELMRIAVEKYIEGIEYKHLTGQ